MAFHEPQALAAASQQEGLQFARQAISSDTDVSMCGCASVYVCVCARAFVCVCVCVSLCVCVPPESVIMGARLRGTRVDVYSVSTRARVNGERELSDMCSIRRWGRLGQWAGLVGSGTGLVGSGVGQARRGGGAGRARGWGW